MDHHANTSRHDTPRHNTTPQHTTPHNIPHQTATQPIPTQSNPTQHITRHHTTPHRNRPQVAQLVESHDAPLQQLGSDIEAAEVATAAATRELEKAARIDGCAVS